MGWADCGEDSNGRPIGYVHAAVCDHPGCGAKIHRGLAYACGGMHGDGNSHNDDFGCEKYFCSRHLVAAVVVDADGDCCQLCQECAATVEKQQPEWQEL